MVIPILLLLVGFALLIAGAEFLVNGASSAAKQRGISNLAIGLTVVAFGTSMPELVVSLFSALDGKNDASFGNVIGSNNFNLLFILGVSGVIFPLAVTKGTVRFEVPFSLVAAGALYFLVNDSQVFNSPMGGSLSRFDSILLLLCFGGFLAYIYRIMRNQNELGEVDNIKVYSMPKSVGLILAGLALLIYGGTVVVDNAIIIADMLGMSQKLIGLTILAAGTSLPELATSCVAALKKNPDIAVGNVIGSNIFNIFFILGLTGLVHPIEYNTAMNFDLQVLMASTVLLMIFMFTLNTRKLDRWEAFILLTLYIAYTAYLITNDPGKTGILGTP